MLRYILPLKEIGWVALGGAIGAVLRYLVSSGVHQLTGRHFPYGTFVVNLIGSLLIGFLAVLLLQKTSEAMSLRALIIIGGLGSFTTFSTFSYETVALIGDGHLLKAFYNVASNLLCCLLATAVGLWFGECI